MEVSVRHRLSAIVFGNDVIYYCSAFKFAYFVKHDINYQPYKFQLSRMSGSNFTEGVENTPTTVLHCEKKTQRF